MADLERFVLAQETTYDRALAELRGGRKRTHWMWWVFPQLAGLGRSETAQHYALAGADEACAYLAHPVLGPRLRTCAQALADQPDADPEQVMGDVDALKLRSSMTLFADVAPEEPAFRAVLDAWYDGRLDERTLGLL